LDLDGADVATVLRRPRERALVGGEMAGSPALSCSMA
jgi:hypothetical protein